MRLVYLGLAWLVGIYVWSLLAIPWEAATAAIAAVAASLLWLHRRPALLMAGLCLILLFGAALRLEAVASGDALQAYRGAVVLRGVVGDDPEPGETTTRLRLEAREVRVDAQWTAVSGSALIYAPNFPSWAASRGRPWYRYGDLIEIEGELEGVEGREYLARQGVYSLVYYPRRLELVAEGQGFAPQEWLYSLRNRLSTALESALHEPQGSLSRAVFLGKRGALPAELKDSFASAGTMHIIAVSGLHVGLVAGIVLALGVWLFGRRRPTYFLLALGAVWLYALLAGLHPSVLRAAIMGSLWLFAYYIGRPRSALTALLLAAALMVGVSPPVLWTTSFQLSFAAMAGLIFLTPRLSDLGRRVLNLGEEGWFSSAGNFIVTSASVTLGAYLATLPLIAHTFGRISLVSLPANLLVLPALPGLVVCSALVGVSGLIFPPLAQVLGWAAWLFAGYIIKVTEFFAALPFAAVESQSFSAPWVWGYYVAFAVAMWLVAKWRLARSALSWAASMFPRTRLSHPRATRWAIVLLILLAVFVWTAAATAPDTRLHVWFLDVGQGDSILIA